MVGSPGKWLRGPQEARIAENQRPGPTRGLWHNGSHAMDWAVAPLIHILKPWAQWDEIRRQGLWEMTRMR